MNYPALAVVGAVKASFLYWLPLTLSRSLYNSLHLYFFIIDVFSCLKCREAVGQVKTRIIPTVHTERRYHFR